MLDVKALADSTSRIVREEVRGMLAPFEQRLAEIENRKPVDGKDGRDADMGEIRVMLSEMFAALPIPERGEKGDVGERGQAGADGEAGRDGLDGISMAGAVINRDGHLIATLSNGQVQDLGPVVGADGKDGRDGIDGVAGEKGETGERGEAGEPGKDGLDGQNGADGRDGVDGKDGEPGKDAYAGEARGLFDAEASYRKMDVVSFNGSEWRAKRDDPGELPGEGWMLSACRGKRGERGGDGIQGKSGEAGTAIVAGYVEDGQTIVLTREDGSEIRLELSQQP